LGGTFGGRGRRGDKRSRRRKDEKKSGREGGERDSSTGVCCGI